MSENIIAEKMDMCQAVNLDIDKNFLKIFDHTLPTGATNNKLPASNDRGFVFVSSLLDGRMEQKVIWTRKGFCNNSNEQYVTASAFYKPERVKKNLRWINALVLDFDGQRDPHDLALRIADAGLPPASMMVRTPSGGIHVWWFLKPVRGTQKAIRLYESLQASIAAELSADPQAVGGERLWRMPTSANVIYSNRKKYKLSIFRSWRDENRPYDMPGQVQGGKVYAFTKGLLSNPGVKQLMRGVTQGCRNEACFALAVAHLISGYSTQETLQILLTWNQLNSPVLPEKEVYKCINSAAKGIVIDFNHYYNAMRFKVKNITCHEIKYRPVTPAKPREERKRSHMEEWKHDLVLLLQKRGGRFLGTQRQLAMELGVPLSTFKKVLNMLEDDGIIFRDSVERGKRSFTVLILQVNQVENLMVYTGIHYGKRGVSLGVSLNEECNESNVIPRFRRRLLL